MKYIENKAVPLEGRARHFAAVAKAAVVDTEGAYTTLAHFLCGENPWGFHNDLRFSMPPSNIRQGERIVAAAELSLESDAQVIVLSDEDYEVLMLAVSVPERHVGEMKIPTVLARAILPLIDALEKALDEEQWSKAHPGAEERTVQTEVKLGGGNPDLGAWGAGGTGLGENGFPTEG